MKKIFLFFMCLFYFICLTGCSNTVKIEFIIDGESKIVEMESNSIITEEIIPYEGAFDILLYYDELYEQQYNNEKILHDTTIYIKELNPDQIYVKFVINSEVVINKMNRNSKITFDDIPEDYNDIYIGIYYDNQFNNHYNGEALFEDTTIYLKTIESGTFSVDALLINKIREQFMNQEQFPINLLWDDPLGFFYGMYGESVVFYINTGLAYYKSVDIQGFNFSNNSGWYIYVWKNDNFYNLESQDIIDYNILSLENIKDLYNVHMECKSYGCENFRK